MENVQMMIQWTRRVGTRVRAATTHQKDCEIEWELCSKARQKNVDEFNFALYSSKHSMQRSCGQSFIRQMWYVLLQIRHKSGVCNLTRSCSQYLQLFAAILIFVVDVVDVFFSGFEGDGRFCGAFGGLVDIFLNGREMAWCYSVGERRSICILNETPERDRERSEVLISSCNRDYVRGLDSVYHKLHTGWIWNSTSGKYERQEQPYMTGREDRHIHLERITRSVIDCLASRYHWSFRLFVCATNMMIRENERWIASVSESGVTHLSTYPRHTTADVQSLTHHGHTHTHSSKWVRSTIKNRKNIPHMKKQFCFSLLIPNSKSSMC